MTYSIPLTELIRYHDRYYRNSKLIETRFVFTGISWSDVMKIIDICEEAFKVDYDYVFFTEEELGIYNTHYFYGCYLFFEEGTRDKSKKVTLDEVEKLYWY